MIISSNLNLEVVYSGKDTILKLEANDDGSGPIAPDLGWEGASWRGFSYESPNRAQNVDSYCETSLYFVGM